MKRKKWRPLLAALLAASLAASGAPVAYAQGPAPEDTVGAEIFAEPGEQALSPEMADVQEIEAAVPSDDELALQPEELDESMQDAAMEPQPEPPAEVPAQDTEAGGAEGAGQPDATVQEPQPDDAVSAELEETEDTGWMDEFLTPEEEDPAQEELLFLEEPETEGLTEEFTVPETGADTQTEGISETEAESETEPGTEPDSGEDISAELELVLGEETETDAMEDMDAQEAEVDAKDGVTLNGAGGTCENKALIVCSLDGDPTLGELIKGHTFTNGNKWLRGWYTAQNGGHKQEDSYHPKKGEVLYAHWDTSKDEPDILCSTDPNAPFEIENLAQLEALRKLTNEVGTVSEVDRDRQYLLVNNITLPADWEPIGCRNPNPDKDSVFGKGAHTFTGTFNGDGHTITVAPGGKSLFGLVRESVFKNLKIYGENIDGAGLITNEFNIDYGTSGDYWTDVRKTAVIENVTVLKGTHTTSGGIMDGTGSGANNVEIRDCTVEAGVQTAGGGIIEVLNGSIENCESYADVTSSGRSPGSAGGLAAYKGQSMGDFTIKNCYVAGTVSGGSGQGYVGGLAGRGYIASDAPNSPGVMIEDNICVATVSGGQYTGGILGCEYVREPYSNGPSWLKGNYFAGSITNGGQYTGGVVGYYRPSNENTHNGRNYALDTCGAAKAYGGWGEPGETEEFNRKHSTFDPDEAFQLASAAQVASGEVAWGLNQRPGSASNIWSQSGEGRPVKNAGTATYKASLWTAGMEGGTVSLTGFTSSGDAAYQNAGGTVTVQATPAEGCTVGRILVVDAAGDQTDITASRSFQMPAGDVQVFVAFGDESGRYVENIRVGSRPQKTEYYPGDVFDPAGAKIIAHYSDGGEETVDVTPDMVSGFESRSLGMKEVTVAYKGSVLSLQVMVVQRPKGKIHVKFTLLGDDLHGETKTPHTLKAGNLQEWIPQTELELDEGALVIDAFAAALLANGYSWNNEGEENGTSWNYIISITPPGGAELEEFSNGPNSGWMFTLNKEHVLLGVAQQTLTDGDSIVFHYTDDYTLEDGDLGGDPNPGQTTPGGNTSSTEKPGSDAPSTEKPGNDTPSTEKPGNDTPSTEKPGQSGGNQTQQPKKGATVKVSGSKYKVSSGKAVAYQKPTSSKKKVTVPAKVKIGKKYYKVTSIAAGAFKGNKKMTSLTVGKNVTSVGKQAFKNCTSLKTVKLGKNVTSIGKEAFKGCKKLKTITITSKKLKAKNIASGAFKGVPKGTVIKVPKAKLKAYTKLLRQKGLSKSIKIKKY